MNNNKILAAVLLLSFTLILVAAGMFCASRLVNLPEGKYFAVFQNQVDFFNPRVVSDTLLTRERLFVCKDVEVIEKELAPEDLRGFSRKELVAKFAPGRWRVTFHDPKSLILTEQSEQLCSIHKNYQHLGLFQGRMAIYEGPLGYNEKIVRVESIAAADLPNDLQIKLQQAMDFQKLSGSAAAMLRGDLEFTTEEALNAALENIDEHGEEQH
ncbi:MAG: hypothetical protein PHT62_14095 [Desulfotomaculaceae bacterium]|nr:hypothetical protein [Desulfotomaculaceae bacterium]